MKTLFRLILLTMLNTERTTREASHTMRWCAVRLRLVGHCLASWIAIAAPSAMAKEGVYKEGVYDDPAQVDADYSLQGEYSGTINVDGETLKLGVQVVALGQPATEGTAANGSPTEFSSVAYLGGLPGDGWDGSTRLPGKGKRLGDHVELLGENGKGIVIGDALTITGNRGQPRGTLYRVRRKSPTLEQAPPANAIVLFDGTPESLTQWKNGRMTTDGLLREGTTSQRTFGNHRLHLEFRLAYQPRDRGQGRSNSGVYLQGRYEVQVLDSFGLQGEHNECGGLYSIAAPTSNMCFPPLVWQTYDVIYRQAIYQDDGALKSAPRITVRHNGILIHDNRELPGDRSTTAAPLGPGPEPGPLFLQDHGNPVRYRNIWVVEE